MTPKLKLLIGLNVLLAAGLIATFTVETDRSSFKDTDALIAVDTAAVSHIFIGDQSLKRQGVQQWILNDTLLADPEQMYSLLTALATMEANRPVSSSLKDSVSQALQSDQNLVRVFKEGAPFRSFWIGNETGDQAYLLPKGTEQPYLVAVPGYEVNLAAFMKAAPSKWRNHHLLYTTWRSLKQLEVEYHQGELNNLSIDFDSTFYRVAQVAKLDTVKLYQYLSRFPTFRVNDFIAPEDRVLAPLQRRSGPDVTIRLEDLYPGRNNELKLFATDSLFYGYSTQDERWVSIDPRRVEPLLAQPADFETKETRQKSTLP